jgi:hypothetical protein
VRASPATSSPRSNGLWLQSAKAGEVLQRRATALSTSTSRLRMSGLATELSPECCIGCGLMRSHYGADIRTEREPDSV